MQIDAATTALTPGSGRLRGRQTPGGIVLVRRGALMNGFVRARATLGSPVRVRIERPGFSKAWFAATFIGFIAIPILQLILTALLHPSGLLQSAAYLAIGAFIWVVVIVINYTSARSEARDLERLIRTALGATA